MSGFQPWPLIRITWNAGAFLLRWCQGSRPIPSKSLGVGPWCHDLKIPQVIPMCIWSTPHSFSTLSLSPRTRVSPLVLFWKMGSGCVVPPLVIERIVQVWLFLKEAGSGVSPVCCKNGHRVINLEVRLPDNAGENSYQAAFEEHRWSWKGKLGEEHDELRRERTPREAQSLCWEGWWMKIL